MDHTDLKRLRLSLGLSQAEMADQIGVSRVYFGLMERGKKPIARRSAAAAQAALPKAKQERSAEADPLFRDLEEAIIRSGFSFKITDDSDFEVITYAFDDLDLKIFASRYERQKMAEYIDKGESGIFLIGAGSINTFREIITFSGRRSLTLKDLKS